MTYQVINLDTDHDHGEYETLGEARGCVALDRLRRYEIWSHRMLDGDRAETICVETVD